MPPRIRVPFAVKPDILGSIVGHSDLMLTSSKRVGTRVTNAVSDVLQLGNREINNRQANIFILLPIHRLNNLQS
jgi:hypothetical protein